MPDLPQLHVRLGITMLQRQHQQHHYHPQDPLLLNRHSMHTPDTVVVVVVATICQWQQIQFHHHLSQPATIP